MLKSWYQLIDRYGKKKVYFLTYLTIIGLLALWFKYLTHKGVYNSAMLYVLVPYVVSVLITIFRSAKPPKGLFKEFLSHVLTAITILFSAPIYLIIVSLTYMLVALFGGINKKYSLAIPVLFFAFSLEGTTNTLSLSRENIVEITQTTHLTVAEIKSNLAKPFDLNKERNWLIAIFPMPYHIEAGSLKEGDVHTVYTRYHRWFVTNTHEGKAELLIEKVSENKIKTRVLSDDTYFSTYLHGSGTEIELWPNELGGTDITLTINYRRNLDPAWYFHPLQKYGVTKMGEFLIQEIMVRDSI